jgi:O-antigen ligase
MFLAILWLAGGASRGDVLGQVVVRSAATLVLIAAALAGPRPSFEAVRPPAYILAAVILLAVIQLIPLPPELWRALPARRVFEGADSLIGHQPWRPLAIVPGAAMNAAISLLVPTTVLVLHAELRDKERIQLPAVLLVSILAMALIGLLQSSGAALRSPFVNDSLGQPSGLFANRNHFALFLAIGLLVAPVWAVMEVAQSKWRVPVAFGLVLLFALSILATGSRAGVGLGALALTLALLLSWRGVRRALGRAPGWAVLSAVALAIGSIAILVLLSIASDRAASVDRILNFGVRDDMRLRGLPTVWNLVVTYFPGGSGFGSFDAVFRLHEPLHLLKPTYFNHAHNDFLEIVLNGGLPALALLVVALSWWIHASVRAWRGGKGREQLLPRLGSAILLLVLVASLFDYPARTPLVMGVVMVAAIWLSGSPKPDRRSALLAGEQHL